MRKLINAKNANRKIFLIILLSGFVLLNAFSISYAATDTAINKGDAAGAAIAAATATPLLLPTKIDTSVRSYKAQIKIPCQGLIDGKCADPETPAGFISRLYQFGLMAVGLAAFGSIVYGALQYILAAGNMGKVEDAKEIIKQAIYGIMLLLGAYVLLYTINPELVNLRNPKLEVIRIQNLAPPPEYNGLSQIGGNWSSGGSGAPAELCKWEVDAKITINGKDKTGGTCLSCVANAQKNSAGQCACIPEYAQYGATCIPMKKCLSEIGTLEGPGGTVCVQKQICKLSGFTRNLDLGGTCTKSTTKEQGCPSGSTLVSTSVEPEINPAFAKIYCREN